MSELSDILQRWPEHFEFFFFKNDYYEHKDFKWLHKFLPITAIILIDA